MSKKKLAAAFVTKQEAEKMGFNYDLYDYEARMVAVAPDTLVVDGVFRVIEDVAILLNKDETGYLIVKIGDPMNKGIDFVPIQREIKIVAKDQVFGDTLTTKEVLEAIKNPIFKDDSPIMIHAGESGGPLILVYKCTSCNKIHMIGGDEIDTETFDSFANEAEKVYTKNPLIFPNAGEVLRKELVEILESIKEDVPVTLGSDDEENFFTMTGVYKCSETCPAIHFTSHYSEHTHSKN